MKRMHRFTALAAMLCIMVAAQARAGYRDIGMTKEHSPDLQTKLQGYEMKINQAFMDRDMAAFNTYVDPHGWSADAMGFMPVSQVPAMIRDVRISNFTIENYRLMQVDRSVYIANYTWKGSGTYQGQPFPPVTYCSTVWAKKSGKWKAVFHQESAAMEAMAPTAGSR